jgi:hypothetical protein
MDLEYSRQIFEKYSITDLKTKSVQWQPGCSVRTYRRAKKHDEANCRFSQFCKRAKLCVAKTNFVRLHIVKASKKWRRRLSSTVVTYTQIINSKKFFIVNIAVFLDVTLCSVEDNYRRLKANCCFHQQGKRSRLLQRQWIPLKLWHFHYPTLCRFPENNFLNITIAWNLNLHR